MGSGENENEISGESQRPNHRLMFNKTGKSFFCHGIEIESRNSQNEECNKKTNVWKRSLNSSCQIMANIPNKKV